MNKPNSTLHRITIKKPIFPILVVVIIGAVVFGRDMHPLILTAISAWCICWLFTTLSWGILLDDDEVKDGYKVP